MTEIASPTALPQAANHNGVIDGTLRFVVIATMAFLTVVDLFAAQALLPSLVERYGVSPAAMGLAVNACTFGMAAAGLAVALFSRHIDRRRGIILSLVLLAVPTALLAQAPNLAVFAALRVVQGLCMATAFSLTLAHLGERYTAGEAAGAFAAYITGNVASNLIGRLVAAGVADHFGLASAFYAFAGLNLLGAALAYVAIPVRRCTVSAGMPMMEEMQGWLTHWRHPSLRAGFGIGFCILFAFIGTFTFVNFVLVAPPLSVGMMELGVIYFVFLPSILTTPLAGTVAGKIGTRNALLASLAAAALGLPLLLSTRLSMVLSGMVLVAAGTFFAQALATGFVSRTASHDRSAASGMYLASYFVGGLIGTAVLGQIFDRLGWPATVTGIGLALAVAAVLSWRAGGAGAAGR
ncbi:MAG: MFS transporter [Hyphomicrobium sp.]|uniref:MFS transporter n=1 Tax=Hyphomicrobium sp. TaxID=82 RepID=UPI001329BDE2|nr:MFS transporter [Hyphomicrobium sp.]KAB2940179.1 MAG: MFS transporter [Hyphomicrobium sp.]MBZ0210469.1 MFS transporter [Hyphomicrobium sp.]